MILVYSFSAADLECIARAKSPRAYEFGMKVSVSATMIQSTGGPFVAHAKSLPGNSCDGHTLDKVVPVNECRIAKY